MEKRLFLAIALSLFIVISWSMLTSKFYPIENKGIMNKDTLDERDAPSLPIAGPEISFQEGDEEAFSQDDRTHIFDLPTAAIKATIFKNYQDYRFNLTNAFLWDQDKVLFSTSNLGDETTFIYQDDEKVITKIYNFHKFNNTIELRLKIKNLKPSQLYIKPKLVLATINLKEGDGLYARFREAVIGNKDKLVRLNLRKAYSPIEESRFIAYRDRYFCAIIEPQQPGFRGFLQKIERDYARIGVAYETNIEPGMEKELNFLIYLGPQDLQLISSIMPHWKNIIYYGIFDGISKFLLKALTFLHSITKNWGLAIVFLSIAIYFILYPLTLKQLNSMKKMQELQPRVEQLRQAYKNNPQKLNKEILELYRQEKINPFGGCLPLLLQIPIFFALYQALMRSLYLKGARFLWIKDLSGPDKLFVLPKEMPFLGNEINLLPILMMAIMFFQQKFSQSSAVGEAAEQQKIMGIIFPLLFGVIFYHMPAGLVLYWFLNSALMVLNQARIKGRH